MTKEVKFSEKELWRLLKEDNENALICLYDRYAPSIYGLLLAEVKNEPLALEILKTTYINILVECKNVDCIKHSLFIWLLSQTKKTAYSSFKVNIDLRSLLANRKANSESFLKRNTSYVDSYKPVPAFLNLDSTPSV